MPGPLRDRSRRAGIATVCVLLALAAPPLTAHSFWPTYYSAKSAVAMADDGLRAGVVIEVPTFELVAGFREHFADLDLMQEIREGRFAKLEEQYNGHLFDRFAAEMELEIDGKRVPGTFRPVDSPANGKGTEGFFVYMLEFTFEAGEGAPSWTNEPGSRVEVRLVNRALEGEAIVLANVAETGDGWEVAESSIPPPEPVPELPEGSVLVDDLGLWSEDPVKRDLRVVFLRGVGSGRER